MTTTDDNPVVRLASEFGSLAAFARALGHKNPTTVQGWKDARRIPHWRRAEVAAACAQHKKVLDPSVFNGEAAA